MYSTFDFLNHQTVKIDSFLSPMKRLEVDKKSRARQTESSVRLGLKFVDTQEVSILPILIGYRKCYLAHPRRRTWTVISS